MMTERELFMQAFQEPDRAARQALLDRACGSDSGLRERVEELLRKAESAGSFLEQPVRAVGDTNTPAPGASPTASLPRAASAGPTEAPGTSIGPYQLVRVIGEGGMGTVYLAGQEEPVRRQVALKIIKPGMDSVQVIARFEQERQALALMDHPNIARVFDAGATATGRPYFVMELVHGLPLREFCDQKQLDPRERLHLFIKVCQAVQHAHQKGVIHRDLKPSNILVAEVDGKPLPKVIDFGVAKATADRLTDKSLYTAFGTVVGTPEYMSPEQAEPGQLDVDTRSDVYSLGVVLYELLTGTTPLERKRVKKAALLEVLRMIREEEPPKPSARLARLRSTGDGPGTGSGRSVSRIPNLTELDWVVMKCLEKDRGRRYETASALAGDLERYLADEPVAAGPPSHWYRFGKFARRNKRMLTTAGVVLMALVLAVGSLAVTAVALGLSNTRIEGALGEKTQALDDLRAEKKKADDALAAEKQTAYARSVAVAHLAFLTNNLGQANEALDEQPPELRHWEWHYLKRLCEQGRVLRRTPKSRPNQFVVSPGGGHFAHIWGNTLWVFDTHNQKTLMTRREEKNFAGQLAISADGRRLALAGGERVRVWDVATGQETHVLRSSPGGGARVAFHPGGNVLAWDDRGEVRLTDLENGQNVVSFRPAFAHSRLLFTADGQRLVTVGTGGTIEVWDAKAGTRLHMYKEAFATAGFALSPDGRLYGLGTPVGPKVCNLETGRVVHQLGVPKLLETGGDLFAVAFSPDSRRLVHTGADRTVRVWDLTTGQQTRAFSFASDVWHVEFVDQARGLLTVEAGATVSVRDIDSGPQGLTLRTPSWETATPRPQEVRAAAFSHDGRRVAAAFLDGKLRIAAIDAGAAVFDLPDQNVNLRGGLAFSPDGRWLATAMYPDKAIKVWDARTGKEVASLPCLVDAADWVAFSPDGRRLAARLSDHGVSTEHIQVWETASWREVFTRERVIREGRPAARLRIAFAADGGRLAFTTGDDRVTLLDAATGADVLVLRAPGCSFGGVGCSVRGGLLAACSTNGEVHLWDSTNGEHRAVLRGPANQVSTLAFSPDARRLACASLLPNTDGGVRLWDVESRRSLLDLTEPGIVVGLQFSPDGHRLMTATRQSGQGHIRIWDGSPCQPKAGKRPPEAESP